ncbi:MAG TPA: DNA polymerase/3'-5' exonuclease PolX, partial [Nitrososphaerales archaeon]|nr:DNA polymerase/3'-5' exonuclease PolX [Nitrososphaerales archaeon]
YRARAYRRAAESIEALSEDIEKIAKEGKLKDLPGIGEAIEKKILEILRTGNLETLEKLKKKGPVDVSSLLRVEGIGPKTVKSLYRDLGIRNLDDFESAVKEGKLSTYKGLGIKGSQQMLERIENARQKTGRVLLVEAESIAKRVSTQLSRIPGVRRHVIAGSYRRMKETIGDLDALVESDSPDSLIAFTRGDEVRQVLAAGETKASVKFEKNFQVDVRVVPGESFGAALLYFTGSKSHNVELRTRAIKMGYRLNEYGLYRSDDETRVAGVTEEEVYSSLGLDYIEPELRESKGEIEAAEKHALPKLVALKDVKGDLQMHTSWSDGAESMDSMAEASRRLGYEYIALTDHVGSLKIANPMDEKRIKEQWKEIDSINKKYDREKTNFHVLKGAEVNIKSDGTLDMPDSILKDLDIVLASIHSGFNDDVAKIMKRFQGALENENVDIIAHPTGRLLLERSGYGIDLRSLISGAIETETVLEIDGFPNRLDLSDENSFEALRSGCMMSVDTDAHNQRELEYMKFGVAQARRAWAESKNILNTKSYSDLMKFLSS